MRSGRRCPCGHQASLRCGRADSSDHSSIVGGEIRVPGSEVYNAHEREPSGQFERVPPRRGRPLAVRPALNHREHAEHHQGDPHGPPHLAATFTEMLALAAPAGTAGQRAAGSTVTGKSASTVTSLKKLPTSPSSSGSTRTTQAPGESARDQPTHRPTAMRIPQPWRRSAGSWRSRAPRTGPGRSSLRCPASTRSA